MPIAEYTLDAGFDEARIRILEPPISISIVPEAHKSVRAQRETARKGSPLKSPLLPLARDCDSAVAPAAPANQRKRRLGNEDSLLAQHAHDVHVLEVERPTKKVKIKRDAHDDEPVRISDVDEPILVASPSAPQKHSKSDILAEESGGVPVLESGAKHVYFHHPKLARRQAEAVAKSKHAFKKCIVRTENTSTTQPKKAGARSTQ
ncbi:hypothetical protein JR316_0007853 [Psilocybe cubensis]|uniref:Uncharacterized protein n=2 Tax=Psilocybe cubensis TaxID=181762 RepID=A0ACB8GUV6_PSICU|nr:hypothetical protein JR316_0007853 [Psilocybe cubensis]KAH9479265.1 hypothetical protein JR316_0007853 [Psilocybe cubensis]